MLSVVAPDFRGVQIIPTILMKKIGQHRRSHDIEHLAFVHRGSELIDHALIDHIALLDINAVDAGQVSQNGGAGSERQACRDGKYAARVASARQV